MELADVLYASACISGISGFPLRVYDKKAFVQSFGLENMQVDPIIPYEELLLSKEESVNYYSTPFYQFYGTVRHMDFTIIIGPIGGNNYTAQEKRNYAFALGITPLEFDKTLAAMRQIHQLAPENFLHLLLLLNFYFNGSKLTISDISTYMQISERRIITAQSGAFEDLPQQVNDSHYTRAYEREMLNFVREGDVKGLKDYLSTHIHGRVGTLSKEQIRQQKNLFIVAVTLVSRAAMDGGLYEDEAFALSDMYIRRCEDLFSVEALLQLMGEMTVDFTKRVFDVGKQTSLSPLVASVVMYIRKNISADLSCETLSKLFSVHRNNLSAQFKADTGKPVSEFVFQERMQRAKSLLINTDKSLSSIADYLGFSSQSHFHNAFKRHVKKTPSEYRAGAHSA